MFQQFFSLQQCVHLSNNHPKLVVVIQKRKLLMKFVFVDGDTVHHICAFWRRNSAYIGVVACKRLDICQN